MRLDRFLSTGHRLVDDDEFINSKGDVVIVGHDLSEKDANNPCFNDISHYVTKSAALSATETPEEKEALDSINDSVDGDTQVFKSDNTRKENIDSIIRNAVNKIMEDLSDD